MQTVTPVKDRKDVPFDAIKTEAWESYEVDISEVIVLDVHEGYGRHTHDESCEDQQKRAFGCSRGLDDSDWIVTVQYDSRGHQAIYGVLDGQFTLWAD